VFSRHRVAYTPYHGAQLQVCGVTAARVNHTVSGRSKLTRSASDDVTSTTANVLYAEIQTEVCYTLYSRTTYVAYVDAAYCYRPSSVVCQSVCHCSESCQNGWTDRDAVWDLDSGGPKKACIRWGAHWRHLANTIEPSLRGGNAACCQIILTTCYSLRFGQWGDLLRKYIIIRRPISQGQYICRQWRNFFISYASCFPHDVGQALLNVFSVISLC